MQPKYVTEQGYLQTESRCLAHIFMSIDLKATQSRRILHCSLSSHRLSSITLISHTITPFHVCRSISSYHQPTRAHAGIHSKLILKTLRLRQATQLERNSMCFSVQISCSKFHDDNKVAESKRAVHLKMQDADLAWETLTWTSSCVAFSDVAWIKWISLFCAPALHRVAECWFLSFVRCDGAAGAKVR
jgi:hypothetical protein